MSSVQQSLRVLVTGANRGIGLQLTRELLKRNHTVIGACRQPEQAEALQQLQHEDVHKGRLSIVQLDVTRVETIQAARDQVAGIDSSIDVLINNAGVASKNHPNTTVTSADPEEFQHILNVNVVGPLRVCQAFQPLLAASKVEVPKIINISSSLGSISRSWGASPLYSASKAALNHLTKSLSIEYKEQEKPICVAAMHPGWVQTDMGGAGNRKADLQVDEAVPPMLDVIFGLSLENTGCFVGYDGSKLEY